MTELESNPLRATGWEPLELTPQLARLYGHPTGTKAYRKLISDGVLVAIVGHDDNGHAMALTHVAHFAADEVVPGRLPTFAEVYAARNVLVPREALMVAVLEPMSFALKLRWERVQSRDMLPTTPGLPTTVKCVQMYVEAVTEDVVFGTQDVPNPTPTPRWPAVPLRDPVGPVPDELLGDAERAALEDDDERPDDDDPHYGER